MEAIKCKISPEEFDAAVHGESCTGVRILPEGGDIAIIVKPKATEEGNAAAVITWSTQLPDGSPGRVQAVTTVRLLENVLTILRGWKEGGHI